MKSEIIEAVKVAYNENPSISLENIGSIFINEIEKSLPSLLKQITLPPRQTLLDKRLEEIRLKRTRKRYKDKQSDEVQFKDTTFIESLRIAQFRLNGHDVSSNLYDDQNLYNEISSSERYIIPDFSINSYLINWPEDIVDKSRISERELPSIGQEKHEGIIEETNLTDKYEHPVFVSPDIKVIIGRKIRKKSKRDEYFREFINTINDKVLGIAELSNLNYQVDISLVRDMELPEWEKIIINFIVPDLGFDEKIALWDIVDKQIREEIILLRSLKHPFFKRRPRIDELNKNLFIKITST